MKDRAYLFLETDRCVYRYELKKELTLIGRAPECDIVIREENVQPRHAQISFADDTYVLRPLDGSEVLVDEQDVDVNRELFSGNQIAIGHADILFARDNLESPTTVHLLVRQGDDVPFGFWSSKSTIVIGSHDADLQINSPLISPEHAIVENFCVGGQFLVDLRSERGTSLNGEMVTSRKRIKDGDHLTMGSVQAVVQIFEDSRSIQKVFGDGRALLDSKMSVGEGGTPGYPYRLPRNPNQRYQEDAMQPVVASTPLRADRRPVSESHRIGISRGVQTGLSTGERPIPKVPTNHGPPARGSSRSGLGTGTVDYSPGSGEENESFGRRRGPVNTRVTKDRGGEPWYLPNSDRSAREQLPRPIIRARGDKVPGEKKLVPRRIYSKKEAEESRSKKDEISAGTVVRKRPSASRPRSSSSSSRKPETTERAGRPNIVQQGDRSHWYMPDAKANSKEAKRPRLSGYDDQAWYLPGQSGRRSENPPKSSPDRSGGDAWYLPEGGGPPRNSDEALARKSPSPSASGFKPADEEAPGKSGSTREFNERDY
jgi:pSer/pThr/pTyr-binding forkhead associated (FHA) protein